jgi:hypothetical protein
MYQPSARIFQEALHRVLQDAGFPKVARSGKERPYIRFHDLRHTFASHWVMGGGDLFKLQKILGHKTVQMTMRYAHLQPTAFRDDYGRLGTAPQTAWSSPWAVRRPAENGVEGSRSNSANSWSRRSTEPEARCSRATRPMRERKPDMPVDDSAHDELLTYGHVTLRRSTDSMYGYSLWEMRAYGDATSTCTP